MSGFLQRLRGNGKEYAEKNGKEIQRGDALLNRFEDAVEKLESVTEQLKQESHTHLEGAGNGE